MSDRLVGSPAVAQFPLKVVGVAFKAAGVSLTVWSFRAVRNLPPGPMVVDSGPWGHIRHPLYLAALLINFGAVLLVGTLLMFGGFGLYIIIQLLAVVVEERGLRRRYGEQYAAYARRVPMWIPKMRTRAAKLE